MTTSLFKDLFIIDLSTVLAGPSVGTFFAELGAKVIKVENPKHLDVTRSWKLPIEDQKLTTSAYFSSVNFKKEYQYIDYETESGRKEVLDLMRQADIVLMNFKLGLQEKLNLEDETLRQVNPSLIIGKVNGFGTQSDRVAYDLILQAETGFMSMNGTPTSGPIKMPVALIDVLAAHHLKEGLLIELIQQNKQTNYTGRTVNVSLYEAAVSSLVNQATNFLMGNHIPQPIGSLHPNIAPYGELFKTKDGRILTFAIGSNAHFKKLCDFLNLSELPQQATYSEVSNRVKNRGGLYEKLRTEVVKREADFILKVMRQQGVPCGEVKDLSAVFSTPEAQKMIKEEKIENKLTRRVSSIAFHVNE